MPRIATSLAVILVALTGACTTTHHVARPDNLPELKEMVVAQPIVCFSAGQKAVFAGAALGVTGAVTGAVFGAIVGHKDRYVF
jgi:hypothetical protein